MPEEEEKIMKNFSKDATKTGKSKVRLNICFNPHMHEVGPLGPKHHIF